MVFIIAENEERSRKVSTNNETKLDVSLEALREIERAAGVFLNSSLSTSKECVGPAARRFASMVYEIARTASAESSTTALKKAKADIQCNVVLKEIVHILLEQKPVANMDFTAMEMAEMIISRCSSHERWIADCCSPRQISKTITRHAQSLSLIFDWSSRIVEGRTLYEFRGFTDAGMNLIQIHYSWDD